jgi:hypothetical protein
MITHLPPGTSKWNRIEHQLFAFITIQLTQERDGKHRLPATTVFSEPEMTSIEALVPSLEGKTERQKNPHPA